MREPEDTALRREGAQTPPQSETPLAAVLPPPVPIATLHIHSQPQKQD